jgi:aminopeptidase N
VSLIHYGVNGLTDLSYSVGGIFFHLLYRVVGRENFNKILGAYFSRFADGGTTNDLVDVIRKTADRDVSRLIDDWVTTTGWTSRIEHTTGLRDLEAYYRQ